MVRLVITDFATKDASESFYRRDEFDSFEQLITYNALKKHSSYISKYSVNGDVYSLNLLSLKHLENNEFLIYITDEEYVILFNHKTVYSAKVNQHFITDDIIKSVLITKHILSLANTQDKKKVFYLIDAKYKYGIENILKYNTLSEENEVIASSLGEIEELIKPLNQLNTPKMHYAKLLYVAGVVGMILWISIFGLGMATAKLIDEDILTKLQSDLEFEKQVLQRQENILNIENKKLDELTKCISNAKVNQ